MRLKDRIALVTAAGSGMGRASAERFASEGAYVIVTDLDEGAAKETAHLIEQAGGKAEYRALNVAKLDQVTALIDDVAKRFGVLHVLFNHAGIPGESGLDITEEQFDLAIDVNLKGAFFLTSRAYPLLQAANGKASIIFTSSVAGIVGSPLSPLYSLTKGGVTTFMKSLALRFGPEGIRVNAICPSSIETPMLKQFFSRDQQDHVDDLIQGFTPNLPLGRLGRATEIADAALFLACDESSYITGVALPVDGGYLAR